MMVIGEDGGRFLRDYNISFRGINATYATSQSAAYARALKSQLSVEMGTIQLVHIL